MNREELLAAMQGTTAKPIPVDVPKWGTVYVRPRTLEEVDADAEKQEKEQAQDKADNKHRRLARAVANVICDEQGTRLFNGADLDLIAGQPYFILQKVLAAAGGQEDDDTGKVKRRDFLMDLALHLGTPVESLRRSMTEREFRWWSDYSHRHWMPLQRIEWYLARITQAIAVTMGGAKDTTLDKFMLNLEPASDVKPQPVDVEAMRMAFGFPPRKKKKK